MQTGVTAIADYAHSLRFEDLSAEAVRHCKRCVVDAFGLSLIHI